MLIDIDKIVVGDRIRKDFGDIEELAEDIKTNGLINPPVINRDNVLLAGERRLLACKSLGWSRIEVRQIDTRDAEHDFDIEVSENESRKDFSRTEREAIYTRRVEARLASRVSPIGLDANKVEREVAAELGTSRTNMQREQKIIANSDLLDPADFAEWDEGKLSTNNAYQRIKEAKAQAERERDAARRELDAAHQDLADAWQAQEDAETEVVVLKRKLESIEKPKPEVVTREVVREVKPKDYDSLRQDNERLNREYQEMWRKKQELGRQLEQANELLGEKSRTDNARWDIEVLTSATNAYLRQYGGKVWAFDQFDRVDKATQDEFEKAMTGMAAFAQNIVQMIKDRK